MWWTWLAACTYFETRDYDRLCTIATEEAARPQDPADRAVAVATRVDHELPPYSALKRKVLPALANAAPEQRYPLLQAAAEEAGYPGWTCPALQEVAPPAPAPQLDEAPLLKELRSSPVPLHTATQLLTAHGPALYGAEVPVGWLVGDAPAGLAEGLRALGCSEATTTLPATSHDVATLLVTCPPQGTELLARDEIAPNATVGRAAVALWLEVHSDLERRATKLHGALTAALLSGLDDTP